MTNPLRNSSLEEIEKQKKAARQQALSQLTNCRKKIDNIIDNVSSRGTWMLSDIQELENEAKQMLAAVQKHKKNR